MANGFGSFSDPQNSFGSFDSSSGGVDLSSSEGLYNLAQMQGGAVSQAANELYHPTTGLLSSIGDGLKHAFRGFVNIISTPSEVVAGILDPNHTVGEAISQHITPSDVLFGEKDPDASIYRKVGSFLVRTATDVLLDPLTYITFGAGSGFLGLKTGAEITLKGEAAAARGVEEFSTASLNKKGQQLASYLMKVGDQARGNTAAKIVATGSEAHDLAGRELEALMQSTIDAPMSMDFAKQAISNMFAKNPAYVREFLDKGGIKVFGQTILSGQRISSVARMIPGMTTLDAVTLQSRLAIQSLFNRNIVKDSAGFWERVPQGIADFRQRQVDLFAAKGSAKLKALDDVVTKFNLNDTSGEYLMASVENNLLPSDPHLAAAMKYMLGYTEKDWTSLVNAGLLSKEVRTENFAPHIGIKEKIKSVHGFSPTSTKTPATKLREIATYTPIQAGATAKTVAHTLDKGQAITGHAGAMGLKLIEEGDHTGLFTNEAGDLFRRETAPIHGTISPSQHAVIEQTLLKDPKKAQALLDSLRQDGLTGFEPNLITAWAARTLQNNKALGAVDFMRDAAKEFGMSADIAPAHYARISLDAVNKEANALAKGVMTVMGKESELVFHPKVASMIEDFVKSTSSDDATMGFLKAYDSLQNMWKATVTSIWPAFHGRNAISNVLQNFLDLGLHAINPKTAAASVHLMYIDRQISKLERAAVGTEGGAARAQIAEHMNKVMFRDATGSDWTYGELRQVAKNHNIAFTDRIVTQTDVQKTERGMVSAFFKPRGITDVVTGKFGLKKSLVAAVSAPTKIGQEVVGKSIEEHARLMNFLTNLRKTGDVTLAARRTKQFLFDYSNLTNFERNVLRRVIPFYTFTRKNLELQVRSLLTTPGKIAAEVHAINTLGEVISGGNNLTDAEYNALPDWVKSGVGILTKKNGDQVSLITNLGTPLESAFQQLQSNIVLGSVSPLIRVPVEQGAGYSFFQGKPLSESTNAAAFVHAPKFVQDIIGFTEVKGKKSDGTPFTWYVSLHPERMNLILNLPPTTRVFTAMKQMEAVDVSDQAKIFQQLTGVRPYSFDLERERAKREKEMMSKLEDLLTKAGVTAQFKRTFIPKEKRNQLLGM